MAGKTTSPDRRLDASDLRLAIVAARFNREITEVLFDGAVSCITEHGGTQPDHAWVPGCFELPLMVREMAVEPTRDVLAAAASRGLGPVARYDAIIAIGCVIRGETPHFDYVAGECARGLMDVQLQTRVPVAFGVLTTEDTAQAKARAGGELGNKGYDAALAAIEMAQLLKQVR